MKASRLKEMSIEEIRHEGAGLREELFKLRFQTATGQLESANKMKGVRRDIARIETVLREMELSEKAKK